MMTRPPDGSHLRGETFIVAEHGASEHAPDGRLWRRKGKLADLAPPNGYGWPTPSSDPTSISWIPPNDGDHLRAAKGIGFGLLIMLPLWVAAIVFWVLL